MKQFIEWAFYGSVPKELTPEDVYKCYKIYCELFGYNQLKKFDFIKEWGKVV